ncbi:TDP-N-acetylfucosamine:lipid II N-acetylfucosaminyltransferase [Cognataquiflexum aquatile]|uniref:TDP-N-acetylfucosamine:lipid II N-acetylfucosaminyltransferase n=1 Tax=Cognataquiflexum aquatile TaxID=2249427 RepID=UPI000DE8BDC1|nr:TDP-N-acetylfucosamine:lipid II N-acetylfucosaminyltransferase [Cognataquiflexum aquatile]
MCSKKKNLHIVRDEKFFDSAYRVFEEVEPGYNDFIIFGKKSKLFYIKSAKVRFLKPTYLYYFWPFLKWKYKSIIIHGLNSEFLKYFIIKNRKSVPVIWIGWGFDYSKYYDGRLFKEKTNKLLVEFENSDLEIIRNRLLPFLNKKVDDDLVMNNINFFAPVLENEFEFVSNYFPNHPISFLDWNYLTIEDDIIKGFENSIILGNNLLFGNSANPLNNHLDGFDDIKDFKIKFDNIICPLNYGDRNNKEKVINLGSDLYGNRFIPINGFLEYSEYVNNLLSCKYVFVNSLRQLAMGNIVLMLYLGAYVILDRRNPVYMYFKNQNIPIFCIEDVKNGELPELNVEFIRNKLVKIWGRETMFKKTRTMLQSLGN